jgi:threonine dehydratase
LRDDAHLEFFVPTFNLLITNTNQIMNITDIEQARERIKPFVKRTALEHSQTLSRYLGTNVFVKFELFQKTGAFKARGAFNKLLSLSDEEKARGVVAVSGGNHAQAVAYASSVLGIDAVVLMPETTPRNYVEATAGYGAKVDLQPTIAAAFAEIKRFEAEGRVFIHPFDDPLVMAGQGTIGLEILEDLPDATDIVLSIGGGGLAGGVATAVKASKPEVRIWGVETIGADAMTQAFAAGHPVELAAITSIAKTLGAPSVSEATLALAQKYLESVTVVSDAEAVEALQFILERLKVLTEPAASCTLAAATRLKNQFNPDSNVVLIFCGGNLSLNDLCGYVA